MLTEIRKLRAVRAIGLAGGGWRRRAAGGRVLAGPRVGGVPVAPRDHPEPLVLILVGALLHTRLWEITDPHE